MPGALVSAFSYDDRVLIERFVDGRELAVSVVDDEALPIVEAIPTAGDRYDFEARYEIGGTNFICPADLTAEEEKAVIAAALGAYEALGCTGFSRVDLILEEAGPQVLEVNAIPGLTDTSLLPQSAEAAGLSFEELVDRILELGAVTLARCLENLSRQAAPAACVNAASALPREPEPQAALDAEAASQSVSSARARAEDAASGVSLGEVVGGDLVEELLELVDDLLGVLDLVLELDRRLLDHVLGGEDRGRDPDRERQRI